MRVAAAPLEVGLPLTLFRAGRHDVEEPSESPREVTMMPCSATRLAAFTLLLVAACGVETPDRPAELCSRAGGTVTKASCCTSVGDFPNLCAPGACSCAPANSHDVNVCACPVGQCFDGTTCLAGVGGTSPSGGAGGSAVGGQTAGRSTSGGASGAAELCSRTGGTVTTASCCTSVGDFPNLCLVGGCSCAPASSHEVSVCSCPVGECFDGTGCGTR